MSLVYCLAANQRQSSKAVPAQNKPPTDMRKAAEQIRPTFLVKDLPPADHASVQ
jgi:hypothetical protein